MHFHLEIVMPPSKNIQKSIKNVMRDFDENRKNSYHPFWDFYVIGGRWAGEKISCALDKEKRKEFFEELNKRNITVMGLSCGKNELSPKEQIPRVDALWNEFFPDAPVNVCPFFKHFNDQYEDNLRFPDVCTLKEMPKNLEAERVIIASKGLNRQVTKAQNMLQTDFWNGVSQVKSKWDGLVKSAIDWHNDEIKTYNPDYIKIATPQDDWLVITVDYHS